VVPPQLDSWNPHFKQVGDAWIGYPLIEKDDSIHGAVPGYFLDLPIVRGDQHHPLSHLRGCRQDGREKLHIEWVLVRLHVTDDANGSSTLHGQVSGYSVGPVPQFLDGLQDTSSRGRSNFISSVKNK